MTEKTDYLKAWLYAKNQLELKPLHIIEAECKLKGLGTFAEYMEMSGFQLKEVTHKMAPPRRPKGN